MTEPEPIEPLKELLKTYGKLMSLKVSYSLAERVLSNSDLFPDQAIETMIPSKDIDILKELPRVLAGCRLIAGMVSPECPSYIEKDLNEIETLGNRVTELYESQISSKK